MDETGAGNVRPDADGMGEGDGAGERAAEDGGGNMGAAGKTGAEGATLAACDDGGVGITRAVLAGREGNTRAPARTSPAPEGGALNPCLADSRSSAAACASSCNGLDDAGGDNRRPGAFGAPAASAAAARGRIGETRAAGAGEGNSGETDETGGRAGAGGEIDPMAPDLDAGAGALADVEAAPNLEPAFFAEAADARSGGAFFAEAADACLTGACLAGSSSSAMRADFDFFPNFEGGVLDLDERPLDLGGMSGREGWRTGAAGGNRRPSGPTVPRRLPRAVSGGGGNGGSSPSSPGSSPVCTPSSALISCAPSFAAPSSQDGSMVAGFFFPARGGICADAPMCWRAPKRESGWAGGFGAGISGSISPGSAACSSCGWISAGAAVSSSSAPILGASSRSVAAWPGRIGLIIGVRTAEGAGGGESFGGVITGLDSPLSDSSPVSEGGGTGGGRMEGREGGGEGVLGVKR